MRRALLGFALAIAAFGGFLYVFDPVAMWAELQDVSLLPFAAGLFAVVLAVACWAESMRRVHTASGGEITPSRGFFAYGTGMFAKQVLPMGNAGGIAIMSYVLDRESDLGFNRTLAVVTVGDFLGLLASLFLAFVGVGYVVLRLPPTPLTQTALIGFTLFGAVLVAVAVLLLYRRGVLRYLVLGIARLLRGTLGRVSRRIELALTPDTVDASISRYFETVDRAAADRRSLAIATVLALTGWTAFAVPLYTSSIAVGAPIPFGLVLFIVPAGGIASIMPLPGGIGGVEFAVAGMTVALTGMNPATAGAMVLLYRICVYWFLIFLGVVCMSFTATSVSTLSEDIADGVDRIEKSEP